MYYEKVYELEELKDYYFKINRIKPTKLFTYQIILSQGLINNDGTRKNPQDMEQCYDFILENILFSKEKDGDFKPIQSPGLDNCNLKEVEDNPLLIASFIALFMNNVVKEIQKK